MQLRVGARTDVGMVRSGNEDNFFAESDEHRGVFVVADGMGGHAAGEVASEMAVIRTGTVNLSGDQKRQITFWGILPDSRTLNPNIVAGRWLRTDDQNALVLNK